MNPKPIFYSKTFWFNVLTVAAALIAELANFPGLSSPAVLKAILLIQGIVNILLRLVTVQPVTFAGGRFNLWATSALAFLVCGSIAAAGEPTKVTTLDAPVAKAPEQSIISGRWVERKVCDGNGACHVERHFERTRTQGRTQTRTQTTITSTPATTAACKCSPCACDPCRCAPSASRERRHATARSRLVFLLRPVHWFSRGR